MYFLTTDTLAALTSSPAAIAILMALPSTKTESYAEYLKKSLFVLGSTVSRLVVRAFLSRS